MTIGRTCLLACVLLVLGACSDGSDGTTATSATSTTTTAPSTTEPSRPMTTEIVTPPAVSIRARRICGPADGSFVEVRVTGAKVDDLVAVYRVDGTAVAMSSPWSEGTLGIDLQQAPLPPDAAGLPASVEVRPKAGGAVLATDDTIDPNTGICG
jgi:hypothetical protein